eukprot:CAMPEP_0171143430 /NCGR_PEP_ID=MMETSP0766_2-20121228/144285_1 /TAXON_ID=439317 /ORGANISM="Gambierdiscus australes, Strain CAWD 149" /LENGTH=73 /DNA_ID=CAMNT_0011607251 /DNA_START=46 /DNA_END=264 /DNA_ORIENTATION=+
MTTSTLPEFRDRDKGLDQPASAYGGVAYGLSNPYSAYSSAPYGTAQYQQVNPQYQYTGGQYGTNTNPYAGYGG